MSDKFIPLSVFFPESRPPGVAQFRWRPVEPTAVPLKAANWEEWRRFLNVPQPTIAVTVIGIRICQTDGASMSYRVFLGRPEIPDVYTAASIALFFPRSYVNGPAVNSVL